MYLVIGMGYVGNVDWWDRVSEGSDRVIVLRELEGGERLVR